MRFRSPSPPIPLERFPTRLATLGYTPHACDGVEWIVPPLRLVSAGPFRLGSDKRRDPEADEDELQRVTVTLGAYDIARFPVTVAEYACFIRATQRQQPNLRDLKWEDQFQRLEHPVVAVSWADAYDYAAWLAQCTGQPWRLPTEAEWEKAARCDPRAPLGASSERIYPWGDAFDVARCNTYESKIRTTTPVGWYGPDDPNPRSGRKSGASPCGAEDLAGNVWEWTASAPSSDYNISELSGWQNSTETMILRGGSWSRNSGSARAAHRYVNRWGSRNSTKGFRLACSQRYGE